MKVKMSNLINLKDTKLYYPYNSAFEKNKNFTIVLNHDTGEILSYSNNKLHFSLFPHLYSGNEIIWAKANFEKVKVNNHFIIKKIFESEIIYD